MSKHLCVAFTLATLYGGMAFAAAWYFPLGALVVRLAVMSWIICGAYEVLFSQRAWFRNRRLKLVEQCNEYDRDAARIMSHTTALRAEYRRRYGVEID